MSFQEDLNDIKTIAQEVKDMTIKFDLRLRSISSRGITL
jgi:hypothetical protein